MPQRLYIVDGHGYIFRAHYGLMNSSKGERKEVRLSNSDGMPTGALYVFARMLMRLEEDNHPEHLAVVFDSGRKNFRTELFPDYKAHRKERPEELGVQMPYFREIVEGMGWPCLAVDGVEADDVIATLVVQARARGWDVVIYSADKDLMQLVGDGVSMIDALHQKVYTREEVIKKMGVPPEQIADFLALVGDTSDNIPGLHGVGDKTAAGLLDQYGTLDALIAANPVVPRIKIKQPFGDPEQLARVQLSRKLVELKRDVEVPIALDALVVGDWDTTKLIELFSMLEFALLVDKVKLKLGAPESMPAVAAPEATAVVAVSAAHAPDTRVVVSADGLAQLAATARAAKRFAISMEMDPERPERAKPVAIVIGIAGAETERTSERWGAGSGSAYVPLGHRYLGAPAPPPAADLAPLWAVLADDTIGKVALDAKVVTRAFAELGVSVAGITDDIRLAAFLLDPTADADADEAVVLRLAGVQLPARTTLAGRGKHTLEAVDVDRAAAWAGAIAYALLPIADELPRRMATGGLAPLYRDLELPIALMLAEVERAGIAIDAAHFAKLSAEVGARLAVLEATIYGHAGGELNVGSPKQLGELLFEKLALGDGKSKRTKTGFSTEAEVLEQLVDDHPIVRPILEHRELSKLKGTYLDALPPLISPRTGRVHTTFNQMVAATGRISSQDPNLQNIPIRSELGREIRRGFVAAPGHVLLAADYSQIELRILAHLSGDPLLSAAFRDRVDVHTQTAAEVFGVARETVTAEQRRVAKAVNYGLSYGQSDFGLARALDITRPQAAEYSKRYFERFPTIHKFMDDIVQQARAQGGARTLLGRWRPIPDLMSRSPAARKAAERVAQNTPMQGAGADLIKLAMLATVAALARAKVPARLLLTVHDELVFELPPAHADAAGAIIKREMEGVYQLSVPLEVEIGVAANWADA